MKYDDLKILAELREKGAITEEEFQREKTKILNEDRKLTLPVVFASLYSDWMKNIPYADAHFAASGFLAPLIGFIILLLCGLPIKRSILR